MDSLHKIYSKYHNLIEYSEYAFTGWILSWILFFIMLPFMIHFFGKVKGAVVNYGFSWISMVIIILGLEFIIK
jgi:hypothetical protein